jgi:hypothetical protein
MKIDFGAYTWKNLQNRDGYYVKGYPDRVFKPESVQETIASSAAVTDFKVYVDDYTKHVGPRLSGDDFKRLRINGTQSVFKKEKVTDQGYQYMTFPFPNVAAAKGDTPAVQAIEPVHFPKSAK